MNHANAAHLNTTPAFAAGHNQPWPAAIDRRACVYWRPGSPGGLLSAIARHRRATGWQGYIVALAA